MGQIAEQGELGWQEVGVTPKSYPNLAMTDLLQKEAQKKGVEVGTLLCIATPVSPRVRACVCVCLCVIVSWVRVLIAALGELEDLLYMPHGETLSKQRLWAQGRRGWSGRKAKSTKHGLREARLA